MNKYIILKNIVIKTNTVDYKNEENKKAFEEWKKNKLNRKASAP